MSLLPKRHGREMSNGELNDLLASVYKQAQEEAKHSVSPCFANCGAPACQKLGCVRVYNAEHAANQTEAVDAER